MAGIVKINIIETAEELKSMLKCSEYKKVHQRLQVLYWLKTKQVRNIDQISDLLGKHRTTVSRWLSLYRSKGLDGLVRPGKSSGRPSKISPCLKQSLMMELQDSEGFSSYKEVQLWLKLFHDVDMSYTGVHQFVRYQLKAKLKTPRPVHLNQEVNAVEDFKKTSART